MAAIATKAKNLWVTPLFSILTNVWQFTALPYSWICGGRDGREEIKGRERGGRKGVGE